MASFDIRALSIAPAAPAELRETIALVFGRLGDDLGQRQGAATWEGIQAGEISPAGFLQARYQQQSIGAIGIQLQPGRVASIWPPQVVREFSEYADDISQRLLAAAGEIAGRGGARLVQALLETDSGPDAEHLKRAGFVHLADLLYLVSPSGAFPTSPPSELDFEPYEPAKHSRFAAIVDQTYDQTRDCPSLNGLRPIGEVLEGYQAVGDFRPEHWSIARSGGRDVGCLLLAAHPQHKIWEIVYMGIVPEARGQGFGLSLARHAGWLASRAGAERLVLAVDAANAPAIDAYAAAGFVSWDRRSVLVKRMGR